VIQWEPKSGIDDNMIMVEDRWILCGKIGKMYIFNVYIFMVKLFISGVVLIQTNNYTTLMKGLKRYSQING